MFECACLYFFIFKERYLEFYKRELGKQVGLQ
jgi:hypothetical protein